jgi:hypothetical protein
MSGQKHISFNLPAQLARQTTTLWQPAAINLKDDNFAQIPASSCSMPPASRKNQDKI